MNLKFSALSGIVVRTAIGLMVLVALSAISLTAQETSSSAADSSADASAAKTSSAARRAPAPSSNWTGFYVGGYAGVNWARSTANTSTVFSPTGYFASSSVPAITTAGRQKLDTTGFTGGGQFGYNHQSGSFVVGAEADFGAMTGSKTVATTMTYPCCAPTAFTVTQSVKTRWLFTARPRVGFASNNALFYVTGGLALTDLNYQALFTDTFATAHENGGIKKTRAGWTGGGGIEYKFGSKWSVKGEYLYVDFRRATTTSTNLTAFTPSISFPTNIFTHSIFLAEHSLRFGVNYHF